MSSKYHLNRNSLGFGLSKMEALSYLMAASLFSVSLFDAFAQRGDPPGQSRFSSEREQEILTMVREVEAIEAELEAVFSQASHNPARAYSPERARRLAESADFESQEIVLRLRREHVKLAKMVAEVTGERGPSDQRAASRYSADERRRAMAQADELNLPVRHELNSPALIGREKPEVLQEFARLARIEMEEDGRRARTPEERGLDSTE